MTLKNSGCLLVGLLLLLVEAMGELDEVVEEEAADDDVDNVEESRIGIVHLVIEAANIDRLYSILLATVVDICASWYGTF